MLSKPQVRVRIDVPKVGDAIDTVTIFPAVHKLRWVRNPHNRADELELTLVWKDAGVDPRLIHHARCEMWMWDDAMEVFDEAKHSRFVGICTKPERRESESERMVDMSFQDYTSLFLASKPHPTAGVPLFTDTILEGWKRLCDNTGYRDVNSRKIVSSVSALRDQLVFPKGLLKSRPDIATVTFGDAVPPRLRSISKPTMPTGTDAWAVWETMIDSIGLMTYIERDHVVVTNTAEHYSRDNPPQIIYGYNVKSLKESTDTKSAAKGVMLRSFDPLTGRVLEALYPPPGDERIKTTKATAKKAAVGGDASVNAVAGDYTHYNFNHIVDQKVLENKAQEVWEFQRKQNMEGEVSTGDMWIPLLNDDEPEVDVLGLGAGDPIMVAATDPNMNNLAALGSEEDQVRYLVDVVGYEEDTARIVVKNIDQKALFQPFHVKQVEVLLEESKFEVKIGYHNLITVSGP